MTFKRNNKNDKKFRRGNNDSNITKNNDNDSSPGKNNYKGRKIYKNERNKGKFDNDDQNDINPTCTNSKFDTKPTHTNIKRNSRSNNTITKSNGKDSKRKKEWEKIIKKVYIEREDNYITGRPTKYHPLYPSLAVAFLGDGHSKTALAALCNVSYTTILDWESKHPEFSKAIKIGLAKGQRTWEDLGYKQFTEGKFNFQVYNLVMTNRFGYNSNKVSLESNNVIEHKGEIKIDENPNGRAAAILDILLQSGSFKSGIDKVTNSKDDEIHSPQSDS